MCQESYGIPYAMHIHDIESVQELTDEKEVNRRRKQDGWVLLSIKQHIGTDTFYHSGDAIYDSCVIYVMGIPRAQYCTETSWSWSIDHPKSVLKQWDHIRKEWECRWCAELEAHRDNEEIDDPEPAFLILSRPGHTKIRNVTEIESRSGHIT